MGRFFRKMIHRNSPAFRFPRLPHSPYDGCSRPKERSLPSNLIPQYMRQAWWTVGWFGVALCIYLSLMPSPPSFDVTQGDKLQHIAAYGMLMLWFVQLARDRRHRQISAVALLGLGVGLEFAQLASGYREFSLADMGADAIGIALGWLLAPPRLPNLLAFAERLVSRERGP